MMGSRILPSSMMADDMDYGQKHEEKDRLKKAKKKKIKISLDRNLVSRPKQDRNQT